MPAVIDSTSSPTPHEQLFTDLMSLYTNRIMSDVTLVVHRGDSENQSINDPNSVAFACHRCILCARCEYFAKMFNFSSSATDTDIGRIGSDNSGGGGGSGGGWAESQSSTIHFNDIEPDDFQILIQYFYTAQINIDASNAFGVLKLADEFGVDLVKQHCVQYVKNLVNHDNVFDVLEQAMLYNFEELFQFCLEYVASNAKQLFMDNLLCNSNSNSRGNSSSSSSGGDVAFPPYCKLDRETMIEILRDDRLMAPEIALFFSVIQWGKYQVKYHNSHHNHNSHHALTTASLSASAQQKQRQQRQKHRNHKRMMMMKMRENSSSKQQIQQGSTQRANVPLFAHQTSTGTGNNTSGGSSVSHVHASEQVTSPVMVKFESNTGSSSNEQPKTSANTPLVLNVAPPSQDKLLLQSSSTSSSSLSTMGTGSGPLLSPSELDVITPPVSSSSNHALYSSTASSSSNMLDHRSFRKSSFSSSSSLPIHPSHRRRAQSDLNEQVHNLSISESSELMHGALGGDYTSESEITDMSFYDDEDEGVHDEDDRQQMSASTANHQLVINTSVPNNNNYYSHCPRHLSNLLNLTILSSSSIIEPLSHSSLPTAFNPPDLSFLTEKYNQIIDYVHDKTFVKQLGVVVADLMELIRFPTLDPHELYEYVEPSLVVPKMYLLEAYRAHALSNRIPTDFARAKVRDGSLFYMSGVLENVPIKVLKGWTCIYQQPYSHATTAAVFEPARAGKRIMLAARHKNSSRLALCAMGSVDHVLRETKENETTFENGVNFYNWKGRSVGFSSDQNINLGTADLSSGLMKLSWHLTGRGGYRCGELTKLNDSTEWEKLVFYS